MTAYYNEIEPYAAQWLRNLIKAGHIAPGDVDERSIEFVRPDDLVGYTQCHFFAGIGIWSHALRLAGWPDDRPVWSGSCPCQPFSAAGKGEGIDDSRHLWPQFFRLIRECRPVAVIGEQVASADGLAWLDHVCVDLEEAGYAVGAVDTCAAGVGAPHIRQRLYWVADAERWATERHGQQLGAPPGRMPSSTHQRQRLWLDAGDGGDAIAVADAQRSTGRKRRGGMGEVGCKTGEKIAERHTSACPAAHSGAASAVDNPASARCDRTLGASRMPLPGERRKAGAVADDIGNGLERRTQQTVLGTGRRGQGNEARRGSASLAVNGYWADADWIACRDGKARPAIPAAVLLAHGHSADMGVLCAAEEFAGSRTGMLRAFGNAIVGPQAAEFVRAFMEVRP